MTKSKLDDLTTEQAAALRDYRSAWLTSPSKPSSARTWKSQLNKDWQESRYFWTHWRSSDKNAPLQRIRNNFGPTWLDKLPESEFSDPSQPLGAR